MPAADYLGPPNCEVCIAAASPHFFSVRLLRKFASDRMAVQFHAAME